MQSVLNYASNNPAKLIETKYAIMLMNQYYTKEGIEPISLYGDSFNNIQLGNNILHMANNAYLQTTYYNAYTRSQTVGLYPDPTIVDRYYFVLNSYYSNLSNAYQYFVAVDETPDGFNIIKIFDIYASHGTNQAKYIYQIIDVTKDYIYVLLKRNDQYNSLSRINKVTWVIENCYWSRNTYVTYFNRIEVDNNYIYLLYNNQYNNIDLIRYSKIDNKTTVKNFAFGINNISDTPFYTKYIYQDFFKSNDKYYCYSLCNTHNGLAKLEIDLTQMTITFSDSGTQENDNITFYYENGYGIYRQFWIKDNYLFMIGYDEYIVASEQKISCQGVHKFSINQDGTLQHISYNQLSDTMQIISVLFSSNKDFVVIGFNQGFQIMYYDKDIQEYLMPEGFGFANVNHVGIDEYDRIWLLQTNNEIHMYDIKDPHTIDIKFEKLLYVYKNKTIDSYLTFIAKNFINTYASGLYTFELTGDAVFAENGTQQIDITYKEGEITVPIVVTGPNQLSCKVYYIKGGE